MVHSWVPLAARSGYPWPCIQRMVQWGAASSGFGWSQCGAHSPNCQFFALKIKQSPTNLVVIPSLEASHPKCF